MIRNRREEETLTLGGLEATGHGSPVLLHCVFGSEEQWEGDLLNEFMHSYAKEAYD